MAKSRKEWDGWRSEMEGERMSGERMKGVVRKSDKVPAGKQLAGTSARWRERKKTRHLALSRVD